MYKLIDGKPYLIPDEGVELTAEQYAWALSHPGASEEEVLNMQVAPPPGPGLEEVRAIRLSELNAWNAGRIAAGYTDPQGRTWGVSDRDTDAWNKLLAMANLLGLADTAEMPQHIRESDGLTMHLVTFGEYKSILIGVGMTYSQIDVNYATKRAQILSAATAEELNSIQFS